MQSYRPTHQPLNVTGSAARSVAAADSAAKVWWDHADALAAEVERTLSVPEREVTASDIAAAAEAWRAFGAHSANITLAARWRSSWRSSGSWSHDISQHWPMANGYAGAADAIAKCAARIHYHLTRAGVPMGKMPDDVRSEAFGEYWRDAAARGC